MEALDLARLVNDWLIPFGLKLLYAIAIWVIGGMVINAVSQFSRRGMNLRKIDPTLIQYIDASLRVALRIALVMAILEVCGIQTTTFAALFAAIGIAIGAAWSGLLSNFAAGIFLMVLRPFKVGDMISANGVTGDVQEIGLFVTTLNSPDNVRVFVGNGKVFGDNLINYTANPHRRVELKCQLAHGVDLGDAIARLKARLAQIPNVSANPAPDVEILEFNAAGTLLTVRPYCHNAHYWQVYFDTNKAIAEVGGQAAWPVPAPRQVLLQPTN